jgi:hypothetical protein
MHCQPIKNRFKAKVKVALWLMINQAVRLRFKNRFSLILKFKLLYFWGAPYDETTGLFVVKILSLYVFYVFMNL